MIKTARDERIIEILVRAGEEVSIREVARQLGRVSEVTVRRSIGRLAGEGRLERTHGGAVCLGSSAQKPQDLSLRSEIEGVDAIILPPISGRGAETLRMLARRRGIPFLAESSPQEGGVYLGPDNFSAGRDLGREAGRLLAGVVETARVLLVSLESLPNTRARSDGFLKGLSETFTGRVVEWRIDGQGSFRVAMRVCLDAFAAHPDINVVFGVNDHSVLAAIEASDRLGVRKVHGFSVGGEGAALFEALAARRKLRACAALFPEIVGMRAINVLAAIFAGAEMPAEIRTPHAVVTPESLSEFYGRHEGGWSLVDVAKAKYGWVAADARSAAKRVIGFLPHYPAHDWYRNMIRAMRDEAQSLGLELHVSAPQAGIAREINSLRRMIARTAAARVTPGDTILVNAGELSLLFIDELSALRDITIVTNALDVMERLAGRHGLKVILTSGEYHPKYRCLVGPSLGALFERLRIDRAFLSVDGISPRFGASAADERMALAAKRCADASREVIVLADHSLVGVEASHRIMPSSSVDELITDSGSLPADRMAFAAAGIRITLADEKEEFKAPSADRLSEAVSVMS